MNRMLEYRIPGRVQKPGNSYAVRTLEYATRIREYIAAEYLTPEFGIRFI